MSQISATQCPIIQKLQSEGRSVSFAVVSKKHNQQQCPISHVAVKRLNLESVNCEKLEKYVHEDRLVVIARDNAGPVIFLRNGNNCYVNAPEFIRYVDKSSTSDVESIEKELLKVVIEELSDDDYDQFCQFCLKTAADHSIVSTDLEPEPTSDKSSSEVHSRDLAELKKDQFVMSILTQLSEIIDSLFETIRESREDDAEQRKAAERAEQKRRDDIRYQETQRFIRKDKEKSCSVKSDINHQQRNREEKRNNLRQENGGLPVTENIS